MPRFEQHPKIEYNARSPTNNGLLTVCLGEDLVALLTTRASDVNGYRLTVVCSCDVN